MAQNVKQAWAVAPPAVSTLTVSGLSTLANATSATSAVLDNSSGNYLDCYVNVSVTSGTGTSGSGFLEVYVGSALNNSAFSLVGTDQLIDVIPVVSDTTTFIRTMNVARVFGGLPPYFKLRFSNVSGAALTAATVTYNFQYVQVG